MRISLFIIFLFLSISWIPQKEDKPSKVIIQKNGNIFQLIHNGIPFFIKGAVGRHYLDRLKAYGGNPFVVG